MADVTLDRRAPWLTDIEVTTTAKEVAVPSGIVSVACMEEIANLQISYDDTTYAEPGVSAGLIVWSDKAGNGGSFWVKLASGGPTTGPFLSRNHL